MNFLKAISSGFLINILLSPFKVPFQGYKLSTGYKVCIIDLFAKGAVMGKPSGMLISDIRFWTATVQ